MSDLTAVAVTVSPDQIGQAIDWVYAHRGAVQWGASLVATYVWAWVAHKQPAPVYDAGGLWKFASQFLPWGKK